MSKIDHLVVLMLENRSFDHVLGWMKRRDPRIDGLTGSETNPTSPEGSPIPVLAKVSDRADWEEMLPFDPPHEFPDVTEHIFGTPAPRFGQQPSMDGFYRRAARRTSGQSNHADVDVVLRGYSPGQLPAIHALAEEFVVCDRWFSSVPGPTWPNRFFAHCGTAGGYLDGVLRSYDMPTIFDRLGNADHKWRIFFHDVPQALVLSSLQLPALTGHVQYIKGFYDAAASGDLPAYSFIEPNYSDFDVEIDGTPSDQHPPSPMRAGDELVRRVYEALRASPAWPRTMLVITWDEHGGFYDHVAPPAAVAPDGLPGQFGFKFERLGVRVPALIVSPLVRKGAVDHTVYDHASIPATLEQLFLLEPLTERDRCAATFSHNAVLDQARDCPQRLPQTPPALPMPHEDDQDIELGRIGRGAPTKKRRGDAKVSSFGRMSNLQRSLVGFVESIAMTAEEDGGQKSKSRPTRLRQGDEHAASTKRSRRWPVS